MNERTDSSRFDVGRLMAWAVFALLIAALNFAAYSGAGSSASNDNALFKTSNAIGSILFAVVWIAISLAIANGRPDLRALSRSRVGFSALFGLGLAAIIAAFVATAAVSIVGGNPAREQGLLTEHWQHGHGAAFAANAVALVVFAPLSEELFVRGLGYGLFSPLGRGIAIAAPAVVWALMHGLPAAIFPLSVFGLGLGYLRDRSGSVIPGMVVHGLFNGIALAIAFG